MTGGLRRDIETIYRAALESARCDTVVRAQLRVSDDGVLTIGGQRVEHGPSGVYAIAIGKAAVGMLDAAVDVLGEIFSAGLAVSKAEEISRDPRVSVMLGSHPAPDARSIAAGDAVMRFAGHVPDDAVVLCLLSGGGSSLVESLRDGVDLNRLRELTLGLLHAGASIHELNAVRSRLSRIKAGGLLRALSHARVYNLIISDVLGDELHTIASGPTVPPVDADADAVMRTFGMSGTVPVAPDRAGLSLPPTTVIANLTMALDTAAQAAAGLGYRPVVLTRSLVGEARETASVLAAVLADGAAGQTSFGARTCLLAGGETTVTVRGIGRGGRNTEAALAAAIRLSGVPGVAVGFLATDGDDGETGAAGGVVDGETVSLERRRDAIESLAKNDSYTFLRSRGAEVVTGPSGTNVNDLVIGLIG